MLIWIDFAKLTVLRAVSIELRKVNAAIGHFFLCRVADLLAATFVFGNYGLRGATAAAFYPGLYYWI